ncbi:hypothetical protein H0E87_013809 [Populus deltoides]|uniref:Uncharacterized protein n=1 Tax=Populus deltoides TaxID=3696 RepID=A0A8T2YB03_POPDE|nr:hypothetical protein H0E87_013809 [Populus deltoides]
MSQFANLDKVDWILINTFYKLECEVVDAMSKVCPLLTIGPTIPSTYLDKSIEDEDDYGISLYEIDTSLSINWLSTKPIASVVYVSFGSCATLSSKQMEEIAWGLKRSNFHLLWVVMGSEKGKIPEGFVEEVENKGLVGVRAKVDEHGIVKREEIVICIKEVMEGDRGREMKMNSKKWKELAIEAPSEGGTSDTNINELVAMLRSTK